MPVESQLNSPKRRSVWSLMLIVVAMFGFGYALVPLYGTICRLTNLNGKSETLVKASTAAQAPVDMNRLVAVQFVTTVNGGRVWTFRADQPQIKVHPGQLYTVYFDATNEQQQDVTGQAVPSIAPWNAAQHLHKTECFCFNRQPFKAGEKKHMPVRFFVDRDLPGEIDTVTLSYTFFDVTAADAAKSAALEMTPSSFYRG